MEMINTGVMEMVPQGQGLVHFVVVIRVVNELEVIIMVRAIDVVIGDVFSQTYPNHTSVSFVGRRRIEGKVLCGICCFNYITWSANSYFYFFHSPHYLFSVSKTWDKDVVFDLASLAGPTLQNLLDISGK